MQIFLIAVGTKMPAWITQGYEEYVHRMPKSCRVILKEIAAEKRGKNSNIKAIQEKEATKIRQTIPSGSRVVALDVTGQSWSTEKLAKRLEDWMMGGQNIALMVGGPDGLTRELLSLADEKWSLSQLTFPHPLVRVVVAEQLYRAYSVTQNHPYHRA